MGLPYAITVSLFGGTVESVALAFKRAGHERWFYYYLTGCIALSLVVGILVDDATIKTYAYTHGIAKQGVF